MVVILVIMDILETWMSTARTQTLSHLTAVKELLKNFVMIDIFQGMVHQIILYMVRSEMVRP